MAQPKRKPAIQPTVSQEDYLRSIGASVPVGAPGATQVAPMAGLTPDDYRALGIDPNTLEGERDIQDTFVPGMDLQAFEDWKARNAPNDSGYDYDLKGAFVNGEKPAANGHWSDQFKKTNHPTFSDESQYANMPGADPGHWVGLHHDQFVPGAFAKADEALNSDVLGNYGQIAGDTFLHGTHQVAKGYEQALDGVDANTALGGVNEATRNDIGNVSGNLRKHGNRTLNAAANIGNGLIAGVYSPIAPVFHPVMNEAMDQFSRGPAQDPDKGHGFVQGMADLAGDYTGMAPDAAAETAMNLAMFGHELPGAYRSGVSAGHAGMDALEDGVFRGYGDLFPELRAKENRTGAGLVNRAGNAMAEAFGVDPAAPSYAAPWVKPGIDEAGREVRPLSHLLPDAVNSIPALDNVPLPSWLRNAPRAQGELSPWLDVNSPHYAGANGGGFKRPSASRAPSADDWTSLDRDLAENAALPTEENPHLPDNSRFFVNEPMRGGINGIEQQAKDAGIPVEEIIAYRTQPNGERELARRVSQMTPWSGSRGFDQAEGDAGGPDGWTPLNGPVDGNGQPLERGTYISPSDQSYFDSLMGEANRRDANGNAAPGERTSRYTSRNTPPPGMNPNRWRNITPEERADYIRDNNLYDAPDPFARTPRQNSDVIPGLENWDDTDLADVPEFSMDDHVDTANQNLTSMRSGIDPFNGDVSARRRAMLRPQLEARGFTPNQINSLTPDALMRLENDFDKYINSGEFVPAGTPADAFKDTPAMRANAASIRSRLGRQEPGMPDLSTLDTYELGRHREYNRHANVFGNYDMTRAPDPNSPYRNDPGYMEMNEEGLGSPEDNARYDYLRQITDPYYNANINPSGRPLSPFSQSQRSTPQDASLNELENRFDQKATLVRRKREEAKDAEVRRQARERGEARRAALGAKVFEKPKFNGSDTVTFGDGGVLRRTEGEDGHVSLGGMRHQVFRFEHPDLPSPIDIYTSTNVNTGKTLTEIGGDETTNAGVLGSKIVRDVARAIKEHFGANKHEGVRATGIRAGKGLTQRTSFANGGLKPSAVRKDALYDEFGNPLDPDASVRDTAAAAIRGSGKPKSNGDVTTLSDGSTFTHISDIMYSRDKGLRRAVMDYKKPGMKNPVEVMLTVGEDGAGHIDILGDNDHIGAFGPKNVKEAARWLRQEYGVTRFEGWRTKRADWDEDKQMQSLPATRFANGGGEKPSLRRRDELKTSGKDWTTVNGVKPYVPDRNVLDRRARSGSTEDAAYSDAIGARNHWGMEEATRLYTELAAGRGTRKDKPSTPEQIARYKAVLSNLKSMAANKELADGANAQSTDVLRFANGGGEKPSVIRQRELDQKGENPAGFETPDVEGGTVREAALQALRDQRLAAMDAKQRKGINPKRLPASEEAALGTPLPQKRTGGTGRGKSKAQDGIMATPNLRDMTMDEALAAVDRDPHLIQDKTGQYIGGPRGLKTRKQLMAMRKKFDDAVDRGLAGANWYQRARDMNTEINSGAERQSMASKEQAHTSAQAAPDPNFNWALQLRNDYEAGVPANRVRTGRVADSYMNARARGGRQDLNLQDILGKKTGIYGEHLDPNQPFATTGTNDIHHARQFGYTNSDGSLFDRALTEQEHRFLDYETILAVKRARARHLGGRTDWNAAEIQAAPWTTSKGELIAARSKGKITPEQGREMAGKTYPDFLDKYTANVTGESWPSQGMQLFPEWDMSQATPEERRLWDQQGMHYDEGGRDPIYSQTFGLNVRPTQRTVGSFEGQNNPVDVARPLVHFENEGGKPTVGKSAKNMLNMDRAAAGLMDTQDGSAWHKIVTQGPGSDKSSLSINMGRVPNTSEMQALEAIASKYGFGLANANNGVSFLDFSGASGKATGKKLTSGMKKEIEDVVGPAQIQRGRFEGGYHDLSSELKPENQGQGLATQKTMAAIDEAGANAPNAKNALLHSKAAQAKAASNLKRILETEATRGPAREDVKKLLGILSKGGWKALYDHVQQFGTKGLPAVALPLLLQQGAGKRNERQTVDMSAY